jgi:hypothetical protein
MTFQKLYSLLKNEEIFEELSLMGKEFIKRKEKENYEEYKLIFGLKEYQEPDLNKPNLAIKTNLTCYNNCYFCPKPSHWQFLDLIKNLLSFSRYK